MWAYLGMNVSLAKSVIMYWLLLRGGIFKQIWISESMPWIDSQSPELIPVRIDSSWKRVYRIGTGTLFPTLFSESIPTFKFVIKYPPQSPSIWIPYTDVKFSLVFTRHWTCWFIYRGNYLLYDLRSEHISWSHCSSGLLWYISSLIFVFRLKMHLETL